MKLKVLLFAAVLFFLSFGFVSAQVSNQNAPNTQAVVQGCINEGGSPASCAAAGAAYLQGLGYSASSSCTATSCVVTCSNGGSVTIPIPPTPPPAVQCPPSTHKCGGSGEKSTVCDGGVVSPGDLTGADNTSCGKQMYCWYCPPAPPVTPPPPPPVTPPPPPTIPPPPPPTQPPPPPTIPPPPPVTPTPTRTPTPSTPPTATPTASPSPTRTPTPTATPTRTPTPTPTATPTPTPPFDEAMCKCDALDAPSIALGTTVNVTAYGKVEGADKSFAKIPTMTFKFYQGSGTVVTEIQKATINTTIVEETAEKTRYQAIWPLNLPTSLDTKQTYRIQAKPDCSRKTTVLTYPTPTRVVLAVTDEKPKSFWGNISSFFANLFGLGDSTSTQQVTPVSPTPTLTAEEKKQLQLKTFTPAKGITKDNCSFIKFSF